ncbi:hypothetical protein JTE90_028238 [Oedothorax gibbosus]|uniref:Uncharacterized protein n=1 Tax=Oedothorax gibbosus TaxID=931172 RepID=A0AAV6UT40_9ARAC|nr:hypothetical protein JTE90_028238 [Oedothorax gibbosus]
MSNSWNARTDSDSISSTGRIRNSSGCVRANQSNFLVFPADVLWTHRTRLLNFVVFEGSMTAGKGEIKSQKDIYGVNVGFGSASFRSENLGVKRRGKGWEKGLQRRYGYPGSTFGKASTRLVVFQKSDASMEVLSFEKNRGGIWGKSIKIPSSIELPDSPPLEPEPTIGVTFGGVFYTFCI